MYPSIQDEPFQLVILFPFDCGILQYGERAIAQPWGGNMKRGRRS